MATKKPEAAGSEISITEVVEGQMDFCILGTSPLICNRMAQKAWFELLAPKTKTAADRQGTMKHDPIAEFRASPYRMKTDDAPTVLAVLPTMFKKAMGTAALDMPGAKKTQIGRLINVDWDVMPVFGIPKVFMAITRSADMNKTPDVRTRAIIPEWACRLTVRFQKPIMRETTVANLLSAAGRLSGIGDWRQEKGSGSYGSFALVSADNADFLRIVKAGGRKAQQAALDKPMAYDDETSEMLAWFEPEMKRRGFKVAA